MPEQSNINTIFTKLKNSNNLEDVLKALNNLNDEATGVTLVTRLLDILIKKFEQFLVKEKRTESIRQQIEDGYKA